MELHANAGKALLRDTAVGCVARYAIGTHFVSVGEDYTELVRKYVLPVYQPGDVVYISEKVISLCQGRVIYKKDMKLTKLAKFLCRFASHSSAGIGVDSVWKMQFAIDHCGAGKVLFAAVCGGVGKLFGKKGIFYDIVGEEVRGLDGFYSNAFRVYGEYGIRLPENPELVCQEIYEKTGVLALVADINDYTCDILAAARQVPYSFEELTEMLRDNPAGQSDQQTPFVIVRKAEN